MTDHLPQLSLKGGAWRPSPEEWEGFKRVFPGMELDDEYYKAWAWHEDAPPSKRKKKGLAFLRRWLAKAYNTWRANNKYAHVQALKRAFPTATYLNRDDALALMRDYGASIIIKACEQCMKHGEAINRKTIENELIGQKFQFRKDIPPTPKLIKPEDAGESLRIINEYQHTA